MDTSPKLRRLLDLPGVADLEYKALMSPTFADPDYREQYPEIDACSLGAFGLTLDQAAQTPRPEGWDGIEDKPIAEQVRAFEMAGWDVTDNKRRPLRMFAQFSQQLWLAVRGVAGSLPFQAGEDQPEGWALKLQAEASRYRRR